MHSPFAHRAALSIVCCVSEGCYLHTVFVADREQSCIGRIHQLCLSLSVTVFVFLHWHGIVFMWVLAAAVVARRLPPKRVEKKNLFLSENKQQGHIMTCDKISHKRW